MNNWSKQKLIIVIIIVIALGVALDLLTKSLFESLQAQDKLPMYLFGTVGFTWTENPGAAWGLLGSSEGGNTVFFILTLLGIPMFGALLFIARKKSVVGILGYSATIAGTIGNAVDRLMRGEAFFDGKVRDFISIGNWFPIFNVADMLLVGGVIFVILALFFFDDDSLVKTAKKAKQEKDAKNS